MYKISVPVNCQNLDRMGCDKIYELLKKLDAGCVFIATGPYYTDPKKRKLTMEQLKRHTEFFKSKGLEVGVWNWSSLVEGECDFTYMKTLDGNEQKGFCCFADEKFREFAGEYIKDFARCDVDIILFDDDYRYGFQGGMNCTCKHHMEQYEKICSAPLTAADFKNKVISGKRNKYRDAFMDVNGEALRGFARHMRKSADEVNSDVRLGLCSCISVWDTDGADSCEIAKLLAGDKTKPFLRLIGAPYWGALKAWGNRLSNVCEYIRMEKSWCGDGVEIVAEGDTYPRPRHFTPSSYLEIYDTAMRTVGGFDGILKYGIDYVADADVEQGYIKAHQKNRELYTQIGEITDGKKCTGIRVYEAKNKLREMEIYKEISTCDKIQELFFSPAVKMMSDNSLPTVYEGEGISGIALGENVKSVPKSAMKKGLVTDIKGAQILENMGVDTGLKSCTKCVTAFEEHYVAQDKYARAAYKAYVIETKEGAVIDSEFFSNDGSGEFSGTTVGENTLCSPLSYFYTNKDGGKFYVFAFDSYYNDETALRGYLRQRQLVNAFEEMCGQKLCAKCLGNPDLYIITKSDGKASSVCLWNIFPDAIDKAEVVLDEKYTGIRFVNCSGVLEDNKVVIDRIEPYSMAAFEVQK